MENEPDEYCNAFTDFEGTGKKRMNTKKAEQIKRCILFAMWTYLAVMFALGMIHHSNKQPEAPEEVVEEVQEVSLAGVEFLFSRWGSR